MCADRGSDISDWYASQYAAAVGLADVDGTAALRQFLSRNPEPDSLGDPMMSGRLHMDAFMHLRLRFPISPQGYTCLTMSAGGVHFAYAYRRRGSAEPEYICVAATLDSRDGEYRNRFIGYTAFMDATEEHADELEPYEALALAADITTHWYPAAAGAAGAAPSAAPSAAGAAPSAAGAASRMPVLALAVALYMDMHDAAIAEHTNSDYLGLLAEMRALYRGPPVVVPLSDRRHRFMLVIQRGGDWAEHEVACGQKIVPMFLSEATRVGDVNLAAWRELAVAQAASDLTLSFVSPSFAFYNQWTYIEGAAAGLFDNSAMAERFARSAAVAPAADGIRAARARLGDAAPNYYTGELGAQLYESLEYGRSHLQVAPVAILHTMAHVGFALRSVGAVVRGSMTPHPAITDLVATRDGAARLLFEYAYAAHCLHAKAGAAHTDLHGNNLTVHRWAQDRHGGAPFYPNPVVAYVCGAALRAENETYVFPAVGVSGCVIDYSRAIVGPAFRARLEAGHGARYATLFYRDQVNRVMRALHRYAPTYVEKHQEALKAATIANFGAVFAVLCAVDFIAIGRNVAAALRDAADAPPAPPAARAFVVAPEAFALAGAIEAAGLELYINGLHDIVTGTRAAPAHPGAEVLRRVFKPWSFAERADALTRPGAVQLVDAYNWNSPRYSSLDYATYPPWARLDQIEPHLGEYKITDLFERGVEPFLESLRPGARVEVIAEQLRAAAAADGSPAATASSWLE